MKCTMCGVDQHAPGRDPELDWNTFVGDICRTCSDEYRDRQFTEEMRTTMQAMIVWLRERLDKAGEIRFPNIRGEAINTAAAVLEAEDANPTALRQRTLHPIFALAWRVIDDAPDVSIDIELNNVQQAIDCWKIVRRLPAAAVQIRLMAEDLDGIALDAVKTPKDGARIGVVAVCDYEHAEGPRTVMLRRFEEYPAAMLFMAQLRALDDRISWRFFS